MEHRCVLVNSKTTHIKSYSELYDTVNRGLKKLKLQVGEDFTSLLKRKVNYTYTAVSTENLYYTPRERFNVYFSLKRVLGDKPVTLVLNKTDQLTEDQLRSAVETISRVTGLEPVSALLGLNLERVRSELTE
jgi:hypothetical protein